MTGAGFQSLQDLIGTARQSLRTLLWRGALLAVASLIGAVALGFLLFAGFVALRLALGPGVAALVMGAGLLLVAAVIVAVAARSTPPPVPAAAAAPVVPKTADAASMAVFTAAFVIGRYLADRRGG